MWVGYRGILVCEGPLFVNGCLIFSSMTAFALFVLSSYVRNSAIHCRLIAKRIYYYIQSNMFPSYVNLTVCARIALTS